MTLEVGGIECPTREAVGRGLVRGGVILGGVVQGEHDARGGLKGEAVECVEQDDAVEVGVGDGAGGGVNGVRGGGKVPGVFLKRIFGHGEEAGD